jgi:radical SAM superfamily enzyme YgiQ (UPF0313 family)
MEAAEFGQIGFNRRERPRKLCDLASKRGVLAVVSPRPATPLGVNLVQLRIPGKAAPPTPRRGFLPTTRAEMNERGYSELDILIVTGDAYVDHAAFGPILIARFLEARGYKVGVVAQPDWRTPDDIARMGRPRLFVGVSAGNLDSMLNKLTAQKKVRSEDQYSPGGRTEMRPNRASIVYSNLCRQAFPGTPIVLGGIEASLRRIAHYDYWSDSIRRSILLDAKADLLVFGMGERAAWEIARRLDAGEKVSELTDVRGTAYVIDDTEQWQRIAASPSKYVPDGLPVVLPSYEEVLADKRAFSRMSQRFQVETNAQNARPILQPHGKQAVFFNRPALPLSEQEMDALYDLPFERAPHPSYKKEKVPAFETVKESIVTMRGCFGGCTFCSITEHEGRVIQSRSSDSVVREVRALTRMAGFSGMISDVGGPTANMYKMTCKDERTESRVFVASGVRYDLAERSPEFVRELAQHHTGGQLSVAPEHNNPRVLEKMKKPGIESYERFAETFCRASEKAGKEQYLIPYFITGHPGSTLADTVELALYLKRKGMRPRQVQDFIPTPMSMATSMYYTGLDPFTQEPVHTAHELREKRLMKALIFYWDPKQQPLAREALRRAGRGDLIGRGPHCLVPPEGGSSFPSFAGRPAAARPQSSARADKMRRLRASKGNKRPS